NRWPGLIFEGKVPASGEFLRQISPPRISRRLAEELTVVYRLGFWSPRDSEYYYHPYAFSPWERLSEFDVKKHLRCSREERLNMEGYPDRGDEYLRVESARLQGEKWPKVERLLDKAKVPMAIKDIFGRGGSVRGGLLLAGVALARLLGPLYKGGCQPQRGSFLAIEGLKHPAQFASNVLNQQKGNRKDKEAQRPIVGQDVYLWPGEVRVVAGDNDVGKTFRLEALAGALIEANNLDLHLPARAAVLPKGSLSCRVVEPRSRARKRGSGLNSELVKFKTMLVDLEKEPGADNHLFIFDDFLQTTDQRTALALLPVLLKEIKRRFPKAMVLINSHSAEALYEVRGELGLMDLSFEQIGPDRQVGPLLPGKVYLGLSKLVTEAIAQGEKAGQQEQLYSRTDPATLEFVFQAKQWLDWEGPGYSEEVLVNSFYRFIGSLSVSNLAISRKFGIDTRLVSGTPWGQFPHKEDLPPWQFIASEDYDPGIWMRLRTEAETQRKKNAGPGSHYLVHFDAFEILSGRDYLGSSSLLIKQCVADFLARMPEDLVTSPQERMVDDQLTACFNPGLAQSLGGEAGLSRESNKLVGIEIPVGFFLGEETVRLLIAGNKTGKTESLRTIAWQIFLDEDRVLGFDSVLALGQSQGSQLRQAGGEFKRTMLRVGELKASLKRLAAEGKKTLVLLDEPGRGTAPSQRPRVIAQIIKELQEVDPQVKVGIVSHVDEETVGQTLVTEGISYSTWHTPAVDEQEGLSPYNLYPGRGVIDNRRLVERFLGPKAREEFEQNLKLLAKTKLRRG
ncbi:hypothetical protein ACFLZP_04060, partial [Patescibacteria group bacterium]